MMRDPFYRDIEKRLGEKLDSELFEQCAADLLRKIHPTLVPIRGGNDAGMDGAIADRGGLPFPLVTTTAKDVPANLRKNLQSYLDNGGTRRAVVLATSQSLSPARRRNLEKVATELSFTLVQIHDRAAFADLLYRDPAWCKELLGITGDPPSLSVMPLPVRPLIGEALVGRAEDMQWLTDTARDCLIVGQPGVGKTFLLYQFAKLRGGLFVHTPDLGAIAAGVRSEDPSALIVDDTHLHLDLIAQLLRLRHEMGAQFRIIANSWPGSSEDVARALSIPSASVRALRLLSKDEIVEVIKSTGIRGPGGLIQEIVNQAEGKPGLAITLANICLLGDVRALAQGDALAREISGAFRQLVGGDVMPFLAAFAVGGDSGMTMQAVADYLSVPLHVLHERASKLAAGGVLLEIGRERLSVRPPALRHVLVRDVFFGGAIALPIEPLLSVASNGNDVTATIIGAQYRGARVSSGLIRFRVEQCSAESVWANYARLGRDEAEWIASEHPEWLTRIGDAVLDVAPDLGFPPLLNAAVGDSRALNAHPAHPLRIMGDWVIEARPGTPHVMERRRQALQEAERWVSQGGDPFVGVHALALSLSPGFSRTEAEPGSGRAFTFSRGFVTLEDAKTIRGLWPRVREPVSKIRPEHWQPLREVVESWAFHGPIVQPLPEALKTEAEEFAREMLRDIVTLAQEHAGIVHWANRVAEQLEVELPVALDPVFEILFPPRDWSDWRKAEAEQSKRANELAEDWAKGSPADVVERVLWCEHESRLTSHAWPRLTPFVCHRIAELVEDPLPWLQALLEKGGTPDLVQPFLKRVFKEGRDPDGQIARRCLDDKQQRLTTAITLLTLESTPADLIELALTQLHGGAQWIGALCQRGELTESIVLRLLTHPDDAIASAAAIGEWNANPKGEIRASLRETWQRAILRNSGEEWFLREILTSNSSLAAEWLAERLKENKELWRHEETIAAALSGLGVEDRRRLLGVLPEDVFPPELTQWLVGNHVDLYRELLQIERLKPVHLAPLAHPDLSNWVLKAEAALAAGYSANKIAEAAFGHGWSWNGNESAMWNEWVKRFDSLRSHPSERIREIGKIGSEAAAKRREVALAREREEEVRG